MRPEGSSAVPRAFLGSNRARVRRVSDSTSMRIRVDAYNDGQWRWNSRNPRKAASNLVKHGVSFQQAATVFGDALGRIVADPRHSSEEERLVLLGLSQEKRLLAVMFVERGEKIRIISARRATRRERKDYEEGPE